ncbi:MAG: hypothetical protein QOI58_3237 [Thermoanaerobaculia bacterium]|nr:hypothetical protein [Thermoanaerobaculia bacterium]
MTTGRRGGATTRIANVWLITQFAASFSLINTEVSMTCVGVPVSFPCWLSMRPAGSVPLATANVYGSVPLTPWNVNCAG